MTLTVARQKGVTQSRDVVVGIIGHALPYIVLLWREQNSTSVLWSAGLIASVLAIYKCFDVWPYTITPVEFATVTCAGMVLYLLRIHLL